MIPNCKQLENRITSETSNKLKYKNMPWGYSISLTMPIGGMGLAIDTTSAIYLLWRTGDNFLYNCIAGQQQSRDISVSDNKNTITFSSSDAFAMTIFYTEGN